MDSTTASYYYWTLPPLPLLAKTEYVKKKLILYNEGLKDTELYIPGKSGRLIAPNCDMKSLETFSKRAARKYLIPKIKSTSRQSVKTLRESSFQVQGPPKVYLSINEIKQNVGS